MQMGEKKEAGCCQLAEEAEHRPTKTPVGPKDVLGVCGLMDTSVRAKKGERTGQEQ